MGRPSRPPEKIAALPKTADEFHYKMIGCGAEGGKAPAFGG